MAKRAPTREPRAGWAGDVVYHFSKLAPGERVPAKFRDQVEGLRQSSTAKGAARILCAAAGGGAACLIPLPEKRTPVPKGKASKELVKVLPEVADLIAALGSRQSRGERAEAARKAKVAAAEKREEVRRQKAKAKEAAAEKRAAAARQKPAAKKSKSAGPAQPKAAQPPAAIPASKPSRGRKASARPVEAPAPAAPTLAPKKGSRKGGASGDLTAMINTLALGINPADLVAQAQKKAA